MVQINRTLLYHPTPLPYPIPTSSGLKPYQTRTFWLYWWKHSAMSVTPPLCPLSPFIQFRFVLGFVFLSICICDLYVIQTMLFVLMEAVGHSTDTFSMSVLPFMGLGFMVHDTQVKVKYHCSKTADNLQNIQKIVTLFKSKFLQFWSNKHRCAHLKVMQWSHTALVSDSESVKKVLVKVQTWVQHAGSDI